MLANQGVKEQFTARKKRARSKMDITSVSGAESAGSIPAGRIFADYRNKPLNLQSATSLWP